MGSDEVGDDVPVVYEPGRRRATYTPPVRRKPVEKPTGNGDQEIAEPVHDDDELASALEQQVSQLTVSTPVVQAPQSAGPEPDGMDAASLDGQPEPEPAEPGQSGDETQRPGESSAPEAMILTDDQVVKLIDDDIASHGDTLSAIEKLEEVLAVRAATMAIPIQYQNASTATPEPVEEAEAEPEVHSEPEAAAEDDDAPTAPTAVPVSTSFDDILNPREPERPAAEPEPTFSSWIAPVAIATGVMPVIAAPPPEPPTDSPPTDAEPSDAEPQGEPGPPTEPATDRFERADSTGCRSPRRRSRNLKPGHSRRIPPPLPRTSWFSRR